MPLTLFSLRNELVPPDHQETYLELNPAVVSTEDLDRFALSAVYIGPGKAEHQPLSMEVVCDSSRSTLRAVDEQSEPIDANQSLTVALFSVSRAFLETLSRASKVEVELRPGSNSLTRRMDPGNRSNVASFLADIDARRARNTAAVPAGAVA